MEIDVIETIKSIVFISPYLNDKKVSVGPVSIMNTTIKIIVNLNLFLKSLFNDYFSFLKINLFKKFNTGFFPPITNPTISAMI